jgi:hypothetical protein
LPVLDMFGLMDPHIARLDGERHQKFDADYVLARQPEYVLIPIDRTKDGRVYSSYRYGVVLLGDDRFARDYEVMHAFPDDLLFRRKHEGSP